MGNKFMHKKILPWLDLIRFLAAFSVLLTHARGFLFVDYNSLNSSSQTIGVKLFFSLTRLGTESVIIFFVLSGFLVGGKSIIRLIKGEFNAREYVLDRVFRIYVPLLPAILLSVLMLLVTRSKIDYLEIFGNIFSLQGILVESLSGNPPLWSLSYEVWFYLLLFFLGLMIISKKRKLLFFVLFIVSMSVFTKLNYTFLFCWVIGAIVFTLPERNFNGKTVICSIFFIVAGMIISQLSSNSNYFLESSWESFIPFRNLSFIVISASFSIFIRSIINFEPQKGIPVMLNNLGVKLAPFSYTLYLIHYPLLNILKTSNFIKYQDVDAASILIFIMAMIICLFLAWLFYLLFEKKTSYFKNKFKSIF
jgi:peptidoglycan/LPS O-acetylase OafA/YrhL